MADLHGEDCSSSARPATLLAIDDEPENLGLIARSLRREYRIVEATTGEEALDLLGREPDVSVILADYRLPGISGIELLARSVHRAPAARRIILTAYADMEVIIDAINRGHVHHFVKKPWEPSELCTVVASVLEFGRLEAENNRLVTELRSANQGLRESQRLLEQSLDDRARELLQRTHELEAANRELGVLAYRDGLTGLYNHRTFQERLREEVARARRYRKPLALVFGDLDHFKQYNDTYGHPKGDDALRRVAQLLSGASGPSTAPARESDVVARYGGEEFVLLLPETSFDGARIKAERLREAIAAAMLGTREAALTMSFGVASFPDHGRNADELLAAADNACYLAKRQGRNQVRSADEMRPIAPRPRGMG